VAGLKQTNKINRCDGKRVFANPRKAAVNPSDCRTRQVFERDDGKWSIGLGDDAAGPFESRTFALEVANRDTGDPPDKPNPTTGADGRAVGSKSSGGLSSKQDENYAPRIVFASGSLRKDPALLAGWYAVTGDSLVVGHYASRPEAARAFRGVRA
jgi:hypothetical protein